MFDPVRSIVVTISLALLASGLVGCQQCGPEPHPVAVTMGNFPEKPSIEVHIVALNEQEWPFLSKYPMSKYWGARDPEKDELSGISYVMRFGPGTPSTQTFSAQTAPDRWKQLWNQWMKSGATRLFILANLPPTDSAFQDNEGTLDARRQILPLDRCKWEKPDQTIEVTLTPAKIVVTTPPKAKE